MSLSQLNKALTTTVDEVIKDTTRPDRIHTSILSQVEYQGTTRSLRQWAKYTGISEPTLRYRHRKGWSPAQVLGYDVAPQRDRAKEQSGKHQTNVTILDNGVEITRRVAAAILKIQPQSLRRRLKQYRHRGEVTLTELKQSSRRL